MSKADDWFIGNVGPIPDRVMGLGIDKDHLVLRRQALKQYGISKISGYIVQSTLFFKEQSSSLFDLEEDGIVAIA